MNVFSADCVEAPAVAVADNVVPVPDITPESGDIRLFQSVQSSLLVPKNNGSDKDGDHNIIVSIQLLASFTSSGRMQVGATVKIAHKAHA